MGFKHRSYLAGNKVYSCSNCRTHMATIESMISRRFNGQHGQAYLFDTVFNTIEGDPEDRQMTTGLHRVRDIRCAKCGQTMGWKYERAYEQAQKYKEGKSILEKALLVESVPVNLASLAAGSNATATSAAYPSPATASSSAYHYQHVAHQNLYQNIAAATGLMNPAGIAGGATYVAGTTGTGGASRDQTSSTTTMMSASQQQQQTGTDGSGGGGVAQLLDVSLINASAAMRAAAAAASRQDENMSMRSSLSIRSMSADSDE